jgi:hypothetical protein
MSTVYLFKATFAQRKVYNMTINDDEHMNYARRVHQQCVVSDAIDCGDGFLLAHHEQAH